MVLIRLDVATDSQRRLFRPYYPVTISASRNRAAAPPQDCEILLSRALRWYYVPPLCITTVAELLAFFSQALRCFTVLCRALSYCRWVVALLQRTGSSRLVMPMVMMPIDR